MKLVITIPAYNEEKTIGRVIDDIHTNLKGYKYKILVVNDGSTDKTEKIALKLGAIVHSHPYNYGLAETFRTEMKKALALKPDIIIHTDADGQYLARDIPKLIAPIIAKKADLVLGSRFLGKIEEMPIVKKLGNIFFSKAISNIIRKKITDCQTGFRAFTPRIAKLNSSSDHTYTQEQIIRAVKNKVKIIEVPIFFAKRKGKSRLIKNPFDYAIRAWINILRIYRDYQPLKFFVFFGGMFMITGTILGLWILYTLAKTGGVGGIPRVILSALFIITGIQVILFGFLADMQKK